MENMDNEVTEIRRMPEPVGEAPAEHAGKVGPGTVLGNYRLLRLIGAGLTSEIYEADNLLARRRCAVKVFHLEMNIGPVVFGRYAHETKRILQLANACITDVYYSGKTDGQSFSVMELEPGSDLRSLVRHKAPLSRRVYLPIISGICDALTDVHGMGLCHGRLHGGQVMLNRTDQVTTVKLMDLGTHHLLPGIKETSSDWERRAEDAICISPEQAKGLEVDARSDIYALSVMLYEMVTGKVPFLAKTFDETLEQHISDTPLAPGSLAQVPAGVEETIMRGLEKDPRKRIPSVEALLAGLDPRGATGAHKAVGAANVTSRQMGLTPSQSREYELSALEPGAPMTHEQPLTPMAAPMHHAMPESDEGLDMAVPKNRTWLLVLLLVVALAIAGGGAYFFFFGGKKKEKRIKKPRPVPAKTVPRTPPPKPKAAPGKVIKKEAVPKKKASEATPSARPTSEPIPPPREPAKPGHRAVKAAGEKAAAPSVGASLRLRGLRINRGNGSVAVSSGAPGAKIYVDGHLKGKGSNVTLDDLPVGTHRIQLEINGKKQPYKDVEVKKGETLKVTF